MEISVEISGPLMALLLRSVEEYGEDMMFMLFGNVVEHIYTGNSDSNSQSNNKRELIVVKDFLYTNAQELIDFDNEVLKQEKLSKRHNTNGKSEMELDFVGILNSTKRSISGLSYLDRKIMKCMNKSVIWRKFKHHIYISVGQGTSSKQTNKTNIVTYILEFDKSCSHGPWSHQVPLLVPNLESTTPYVFGGTGSHGLSRLTEDLQLLSSFEMDVKTQFEPLFQQFSEEFNFNCRSLLDAESRVSTLENEVMSLKTEISHKLENSSEMNKIKIVQSDLVTALKYWCENNFSDLNCIDGIENTNDSSDMFANTDEYKYENVSL